MNAHNFILSLRYDRLNLISISVIGSIVNIFIILSWLAVIDISFLLHCIHLMQLQERRNASARSYDDVVLLFCVLLWYWLLRLRR